MSDQLLAQILTLAPRMRAYAIVLTKSATEADDLVQETLLRAWRFRSGFVEGTNLKAWLFRIMRNEFLNRVAAAKNTVEDVNGRYAAELVTNPDQEFHMRYNELLRGIEALSPDTREALLLTAAAGMSYAEAATLCGCAVGTIKSRVNRARSFLTDYVEGERQISRKSEYREAPERARVRRT